MLPDSLLSSPFCSSLVSFSFLLQLSVSRSGSVREARWHQAQGSPFLSLSLGLLPSLCLCLCLSALSWTVLDCQFSPGFIFLCRAAEFPLGLLWRCEGPCPLIILLAPHSSPFSMPLLFSLTVSPHSSHSLSLGLLQRDPLTRPCKKCSTAGC